MKEMNLSRAFMLAGIINLAEESGEVVANQVSSYLMDKYSEQYAESITVMLEAVCYAALTQKDQPNPLLDCIDALLGDE